MRLKADHVEFPLWFDLFVTLAFIKTVTNMYDAC